MSLLAAAGVGAAAQLAGSIYQNRQNKKAAQKQMDFQDKMSSTAHQREVNDLRAAGLNPILSAGGSGASAPSGASYQAANVADGISGTINQTAQVKNLKDLQQQQINQSKATVGQTSAQTEVLKTENEIQNINKEALKSEAKFRAEKARVDADYYKYEKAINAVGNVAGTVGGAMLGGSILKGGIKQLPKILKKSKPNPNSIKSWTGKPNY